MSLTNKQICSPIILNFTSDYRASGRNSNFYSYPYDLGVHNYNSVCVVAASIPRSFYNVPSNYNTFIVQENLVNRTITLPPGSYNKTNLQSNLQTQLNTGAPSGWSYTISYPNSTQPQTFKYTITVSGNGGIQPKFIFTDAMYHQLGFEPDSTNTFTTNSLTSLNVIDLSYISQVYIKSNMIINSNDGILQEILTYGSYPMGSFATFQQQDFEMNSRDLNKDNANSWEFVLVDSFDREVDLNGIPWSFSLCMYCRNDTHEMLRDDIKLRNEERLFKIQEEMTKLESKVIPVDLTGEKLDLTTIMQYPNLAYGASSSISFLIPQKSEPVEEEKKEEEKKEKKEEKSKIKKK